MPHRNRGKSRESRGHNGERKREFKAQADARAGVDGAAPAAEPGPSGPWQDPREVTNARWTSYYKEQKIVDDDEWDEFESSMRQALPTSFRLTGSPHDPSVVALRNYMMRNHVEQVLAAGGQALEPIAWYPDQMAWRLNVSRDELRGKGAANPALRGTEFERREPALVAFHHFLTREGELGALSRQEEVSMIPPLVLAVEPHHAVLDMCAAPGSKTQQMIEALEGGPSTAPPTGVIVANDSDLRRCNLLVHQCKRLNSPHMLITNLEAQQFPSRLAHAELRFDRVLCDVPCSSDGTMRKAPDMWRRWTERLAHGLHRLQLQIACRGVELCKPGGRLVYSTCSLNPLENEAVVAALLRRYGGALRLLEPLEHIPALKRARVLETWRVRAECGTWYDRWDSLPEPLRAGGKLKESFFPPTEAERAAFGLARCLRVLPHSQNTGGFFVALFEKTAEVETIGAAGSAAAAEGRERQHATAKAAKAAGAGDDATDEPVAEPHAKQRKLDDAADAADAPPTPPAADAPPVGPRKKPHATSENVAALLHGREGKAACDRMFSLRPALLEELADFYGIDRARLPLEQFISRSTVAKTIVLISDKVLSILRQDASTKLAVVNTGLRLLEWSGLREQECQYRLCQEGLLTLVRHGYITKQLVRAPVSDLLLLYQKRNGVRADELTPETFRQLLALRTGCFALVSELDDAEMSADGAVGAGGAARKHTFVCSAMWSRKRTIDVLVPKVEANSFLVWVADVPGVAPTRREQSQAGAAEAAATAATAAQ